MGLLGLVRPPSRPWPMVRTSQYVGQILTLTAREQRTASDPLQVLSSRGRRGADPASSGYGASDFLIDRGSGKMSGGGQSALLSALVVGL